MRIVQNSVFLDQDTFYKKKKSLLEDRSGLSILSVRGFKHGKNKKRDSSEIGENEGIPIVNTQVKGLG